MHPFIHANLKLLSNSSNILLHRCPRKFQLYKLLKPEEQDPLATHIDFDFGTWVGIGVQEYLTTGGDMNAAMFAMMMSNRGFLNDEDGEIGRKKKTFGHALIALEGFAAIRDSDLQDYDLVYIDGRPACELGFILTCIDGFTYRGFLDVLLINKITRELTVLELKTTGWEAKEASYKNSGQALGYSLVVDAIAATMPGVRSSWHVKYPVYQCSKREWTIFEFTKNHTQRATWMQDLLIDIKQIIDYATIDHFPMRGESCTDYNRVCEYFDVCDFKDSSLIGDIRKVEEKKDDMRKYSFSFDLLELVSSQTEKHES